MAAASPRQRTSNRSKSFIGEYAGRTQRAREPPPPASLVPSSSSVDLDIEKFFDRVNHDLLMQQLRPEIGRRAGADLVGQITQRQESCCNGVVQESGEGTPQGGPLSPLAGQHLSGPAGPGAGEPGLAHVRYADDCNIYVRSAAGRPTGACDSISRGSSSTCGWRSTREEWHGTTSGTQVPGFHPDAEAGDRNGSQEPRAVQGPGARTMGSGQSRSATKNYATNGAIICEAGGLLPAGRGRAGYDQDLERLDTPPYPEVASGSGGTTPAGGTPPSASWASARSRLATPTAARSMAHGEPPGRPRSVQQRRSDQIWVLMPSDSGGLKPAWCNRRMRKTARPVVWEPWRVQSRQGDPMRARSCSRVVIP